MGEQASVVLKQATKKEDVVYVQTDGSMVLTREDKWQEIKVGRIFRQSDLLKLSEKRQEVRTSLYSADLGEYSDFLKKFEPMGRCIRLLRLKISFHHRWGSLDAFVDERELPQCASNIRLYSWNRPYIGLVEFC